MWWAFCVLPLGFITQTQEDQDMENNQNVLKKESGLTYYRGGIMPTGGTLVLTDTELSFKVRFKKENEFSIPIKKIQSINCKKGFGTGSENMFIVYEQDGQEKKIKIKHSSFTSMVTVGNLSRLGAFYFSSWEQAINDARRGNKSQKSDLDELSKLAELKDKNIITEEEFTAKKKMILGL